MHSFSLSRSPFSRRFARFGRRIALISLTASCFFACKNGEEEPEARTEPWKKESSQEEKLQANKKVLYRVAPGQLLHFELPGKKARPEGAISGLSGQLSVDLNALEFVEGQLEFDLRQLRIAPDSARLTASKRNRPPSDAPDSYDGTLLAQQWLGLGARAPDREQLAQASFVVRSARALSHPSAHAGAHRKREDKKPGEARKVFVTAVGELKMRGLSVDRHIQLTLHFIYPEKAVRGSVPEKITASLRGNIHVPLAEYEIKPRDAAGHVISDQLSLLGKVLGTVAKVSGTIELVPASAPPAAAAPPIGESTDDKPEAP